MNHCLFCHEAFMEKASWESFLGFDSVAHLCPICEKKLERIDGDLCEICGRPFSEGKNNQFRHENTCNDCIKWEKDKDWQGVLKQNRSVYRYTDFLKEVIYRYKYRGDAKLSELFAEPMRKLYKKHFPNHIIVPMPLSEKRLYDRGFNQAELLAENIGEPIYALKRIQHEEKQSKKNRKERLDFSKSNPFVTGNSFNNYIVNNDIIIIDDIYTTGATVRLAAKVLQQVGAKSVSSLTIVR